MEEVPQVQFIDTMMNQVQKTVEVSRVQFIDRVVDDPAVVQRQASTIEARESQDYPRDQRRDSDGEQADEIPDATPFGKADRIKERRKAEGQDQDVDVERFSDLVLPSSQPSLERKVFYASMASSDEEEEEPEQEQAEARSLVQGRERRREEDETDTQGPGSELVQVAPNMVAGGSHPQATMDQEWAKELREIRRMVEFLVHRERKLDVKTDVAARRLVRLGRESSQLKDEERGASLEEAHTDHTKVVKLTVDKWFVGKGYGFVAPTGEVVFIHASVVQGAEVLVVGTEAWTQVVSDHARAEEGIEPERRGGRERGGRKRTERGQ